MFWFSGCEACEILVPQPGIEPIHPTLGGEISTTGSPGKSLLSKLLREDLGMGRLKSSYV